MADDFYSDGEREHRTIPDVGLPSIVEVPSETSSLPPDSSRSEDTARTARTEDADNSGDENRYTDEDYDDDDDDDAPPASGRRSRKGKVKNGRFHIDMTPPDKLLRKAEKKAKHYAAKGKSKRALDELIRCTALARIVYGDGHWRLAKSHADLGRGYLDIKAYAAQAQYHSEQAKNIMMSGVQMSTGTERASVLDVSVNIHYTLGRSLAMLKKLTAAEQALNKAEKLARERSKLSSVSENSIETWQINIYQALARVHARQQNFAMAHEYFDKTLDVMDKRYGPDAVEMIAIYQALGKLEQTKGKHADHEKAIDNYLQAHSIASANHKEGSEQIAETAHALAMAYASVGNDDAETSAESYLNECLATYQSIHGPHHVKTLAVQDDLARLMIRTDRQEEGIGVLKSTIDAKKEVYGEYSAEVAETWKLVGNIHLAQGDSEKALRSLKKCHNIECAKYGTNHKKSKDTQRTLDILMANPNISARMKKSKAEEMKERPRFNSVVNRSGLVGATKT